MHKRTILNILLIIGMCVSLFLVYEHFSPSASKFCTFGAKLDCGIVNKSPYANLDGLSYLLTIEYKLPIPLIDLSGINIFLDFLTANATLGFLTLLLILGLNTRYKSKQLLFIKPEANTKWMRGILLFGVIYGAYLFYIQHAILKTYCIFCLTLDLILISSLILAWNVDHDKKTTKTTLKSQLK